MKYNSCFRIFCMTFVLVIFTASIVFAQTTEETEIENLAQDIQTENPANPAEDADKKTAKNLAEELKKEMSVSTEENEILAEQHYQTGLKYYKKGYYKKAIEEFRIVNELVVDYRKNAKYLTKAEKKYARESQVKKSKDLVLNKLDEGHDIFLEGKLLFDSGYYDKAYAKFEAVVEKNPNNVLARHYMDKILEERRMLAQKDRELSYKRKLLDIQDAWVTDSGSKSVVEDKKEDESSEKQKSQQQMMLEKKANQVIPEINFTNANLRDVIDYLSKISGVNIILDENIFAVASTSEKKEEKAAEADDFVDEVEAETETLSEMSEKVTISLSNIPLLEALKYILSAKGLRYRIDEYAILISTPERLSQVEMDTRYYKLASGIGGYTEFNAAAGADEQEATEDEEFGVKATTTIVDVIKQSGVPFPEGSRVFLDQRTGILIVKNTPENLAIIEDIIKTLDVTPFQVQIEAKFIEVQQGTLAELGMEWIVAGRSFQENSSFGSARHSQFNVFDGSTLSKGLRFSEDEESGTLGDIFRLSGVLTNPEYQLILHALQQSNNADLLSAPRITTVNNQQAKIKVVDEVRYPNEYEVTQPTFNEQGTVTTPAVVVPGDFQMREVGIILTVTPSVGADRQTITLTLLPEVSTVEEYEDWDDFGVEFGTGEDRQRISLRQPTFRSSNASTTIIVQDGETVVMGGLIQDTVVKTKDKIPILGDLPLIGRMFRVNVDQSTKKNLLIFVTANLLTPKGSRLSLEQTEIL